MRAINDALPLIRSADEVTVMTVRARVKDLEPGGISMERVVRHLERHGIAARAVQSLHLGSAISDELLSRSVASRPTRSLREPTIIPNYARLCSVVSAEDCFST